MDTFAAQGIHEMRFVRLPYGAKAIDGVPEWDEKHNDTVADYSGETQECMRKGYAARNLYQILSCWSFKRKFISKNVI